MGPNGKLNNNDFKTFIDTKYLGYITNFEIFILFKILDPEKTNSVNFYDYKHFMRTIADKADSEYIH